MSNDALKNAARILGQARLAIAFTGAGISVESGIPPFRGPGGIWSRYDPEKFEKNYFRQHPEEVWPLLRKIFFDELARAEPNPAHQALALLEDMGRLAAVITQNIDGLHQAAGSRTVYEYHGSTRRMQCMDCRMFFDSASISLETLPPPCPNCGGLLKPDFVFFSEAIPFDVHTEATRLAKKADVCLVVGTCGEVMPAGRIPRVAANAGATVIEINVQETGYTRGTTDILLQGKAGTMLPMLVEEVVGRHA